MRAADLGRAALVAAALAALAACGSSAGPATPPASPPSSPAGCSALPDAIGPDVAGSLTEADSGGTYCVRLGDRLSVFLSVPSGQVGLEAWSVIGVSDVSVLRPVPNGALTLVRGVTAGIYQASVAGTSRLTSTLPPCTAATASACPAAERWQVTVVVRG